VGTSSYYRVEALQKFEDERRRAQICQVGMRLVNRPLNLLPFWPIFHRLTVTNGVPVGLREIPISQIVGSLGRARDYDRRFRPLRDSQRNRWVDIWVIHKTNGWDPIVVRQIGNLYFVEDGHHRTSVANAAGLVGIYANVTMYPVSLHFDAGSTLTEILSILEQLAEIDLASST